MQTVRTTRDSEPRRTPSQDLPLLDAFLNLVLLTLLLCLAAWDSLHYQTLPPTKHAFSFPHQQTFLKEHDAVICKFYTSNQQTEKTHLEGLESVQLLRACGALAEDLGLAPSTHRGISQVSKLQFPGTQHPLLVLVGSHMHIHTEIQIIK